MKKLLKNKVQMNVRFSYSKKQLFEILFLTLICVSIVFTCYSNPIHADNYNYAIEEIHTYDNSIFEGNINTTDTNYSSRLYANKCMSLLMKTMKCSWYGAATLLVRFNYILVGIATAFLACRISQKHRLFIGIILSCCIILPALTTLGFSFTGLHNVFLGTAIPLAIFAIGNITGKNKNWSAAWFFASLAMFMHVHEGIWSGCIIGVIWLSCCIADKEINWKALTALPIFILSTMLVVLPPLMHAETVDEVKFIEIYAFIRTPHHLLLSYWGAAQIWIAAICVLIPAVLFLVDIFRKHSAIAHREKIIEIVSMGILWCILLSAEYFFTEISPNSTIVTMYLPKCFKYITLLAYLLYITIGLKKIDEHKYIQGMAILGILFFEIKTQMTLLLIYIICEFFNLDEKIFNLKLSYHHEILSLFSMMLIYITVYMKRNQSLPVLIFCGCALIYEYVFPYIKAKKTIGIFLLLFACGGFLKVIDGRVVTINREGISYISGTQCMIAASGEELYQLALQFNKVTNKEDCFLGDSHDKKTGMFQLISQRNCYCVAKNTPSSKSAVIEWYDRIQATEMMTTCTAAELAELLTDIDVEYTLLSPERYDEIAGSGLFEKVIANDAAVICRLKEG